MQAFKVYMECLLCNHTEKFWICAESDFDPKTISNTCPWCNQPHMVVRSATRWVLRGLAGELLDELLDEVKDKSDRDATKIFLMGFVQQLNEMDIWD